jgi:kynurenine formamidase
MATIIDLSVPLGGDTTAIPGHPKVIYELIHTHEKHARTNATITFSIHMGTHIDPPYHFDPNGLTIDEVPLDRLMRPGFVFDIRGKIPENTAITVKHLLDNNELPPGGIDGRIVIINSDWARRMYNTESYYSKAPYLETETAKWLVDQGITAVGLDNPPDAGATHEPRPGDCPVHRTLLENGVCLIENLTNIEKIPTQEPRIIAFPLKIYKGCGGPARVVAIVDD